MNMPEIALADWRLPVHGADAVHFCAKYDVNTLQMDFGGPGRAPLLDERRQNEIIESCEQDRVRIIALAVNQFNDIGLGRLFNRSDKNKVKKLIVSILNAAQRLKVPLVFFPSFRQGLIRDREALIRTARMLNWACCEARDRCLLVGNENDLSPTWARHLITEVAAENFCLIFDCYNYKKIGISAMELLIDMPGSFFSQVHVKDGRNGEDGHVYLGYGDGNITDLLEKINEIRLAEYYVLENDYRHGDSQHLDADLLWLSRFLHQSTSRVDK